MRRLPELYRELRRYTLGWLGAIVVVLLLGGCAAFMLAGGGPASDTDAVRTWLQSRAGGGAPRAFAERVTLDGPCVVVGARSAPPDAVACRLSGMRARTCFEIDEDGHVGRGGWQLASIPECLPLRYSRSAHALVDVQTGRRYSP